MSRHCYHPECLRKAEKCHDFANTNNIALVDHVAPSDLRLSFVSLFHPPLYFPFPRHGALIDASKVPVKRPLRAKKTHAGRRASASVYIHGSLSRNLLSSDIGGVTSRARGKRLRRCPLREQAGGYATPYVATNIGRSSIILSFFTEHLPSRASDSGRPVDATMHVLPNCAALLLFSSHFFPAPHQRKFRGGG